MNEKENLEYFRSKGLQPWQARFVVDFLSSRRERYWELVAPTGAGKTRLAGVLVAHELESCLPKRILVLVPSTTLVHEWQSALLSFWPQFTRQTNKPSIVVVDWKTFLELDSNAPNGESPWPINAVILMNIDLTEREDIAVSLEAATWDLVVFDEAHAVNDVGKSLFNRLLRAGAIKHALLLTNMKGRALISNVIKRVSVSLGDLMDWKEQPLFPSSKPKIVWIYYKRSEEEQVFLKELEKFADMLADAWSYGRLEKEIILRVASSSMYAARGILQHLHDAWRLMRNKVVHGIPWADEDIERAQDQIRLFADELGVVRKLPRRPTIKPQEFLLLFQTLETLLDQIEEIPTDPKLDAVVSFVRQYYEVNEKPHLCVFSSFEDTVHYVESTLQDLGMPLYSMTFRTEFRERLDRFRAFHETGGLLVLTDACSEGMDLRDIDECVNYDLPLDKGRLMQRLGRFARFGRKAEFTMIALRDESKALSLEERIRSNLKDVFTI
jgi:hypothetical protein